MMSSLQQDWPESIVRVQSLSESGFTVLPDRYVKPPSERPSFSSSSSSSYSIHHQEGTVPPNVNIPLVDLSSLEADDKLLRESTLTSIGKACREWGFFQVVNHGVNPTSMRRMKEVWKQFFHLPSELKEVYANSPRTYEGYGSRLGVKKGAILDWSDYFFLNYLPPGLKDHNKWPAYPSSCREDTEEYSRELVKLCGKLMKVLSVALGLGETYLQDCFGGEEIGACLRVNFYPKCPQPELTLGLSSHSDPGGMTLLLPDDHVAGLQVRKGDEWITVQPVPDSFIVNIGDQIQIMSNAIYRSVEHRVIVNSSKERLSIAFFYNPKSDLMIEPAKLLVTEERPSLYQPMTYDQYRLYIRTRGPQGKSQMNSLQTTPPICPKYN